jgi:hypothetical protein
MLLPKDANYEIQIQESNGLSAYRLTSKTESPAPKYDLVVAFPGRESCSRALKCLVVAEIN